MLVDLKKILDLAEEGEYCIPAFNVYNMETARGVINVAEELRSPVILQIYSRLATSGIVNDLGPIMVDMANKASVPVCVHLDHGAGELEVIRCLRNGMTGIMIDASQEELEVNIAKTKKVVETCGYVGVSVEGELGHIGRTADGAENAMAEYTHPEEAERYVKETGVKALAVMVGTAHGRYKKAPVLDIERIAEIKKRTGIALVLHGGSGVPDEQIKRAIKAGIRKMNFSTDLCYAFTDACRNMDKSVFAIDMFMKQPIADVEGFVRSKIKVLGSANRV